MTEKKRKFEADLKRLVDQGHDLGHALQYKFSKRGLRKSLAKNNTKGEIAKIISELPSFSLEYQRWYSEALALIRHVLPDRLQDFKSYYEYPRARKEITFKNYMIKDCLQELTLRRGSANTLNGRAAIAEFTQQLAIVEAARNVLNSTLLDLRQILQADLFDSELDSARELARAGHLRAAGVICGVVIEKHLGQVCSDHSVSVGRKKSTINNLAEVLKINNIIDVPVWRRLQHLADVRNLCSHNKKREPAIGEVEDLLNGTGYVIKLVF